MDIVAVIQLFAGIVYSENRFAENSVQQMDRILRVCDFMNFNLHLLIQSHDFPNPVAVLFGLNRNRPSALTPQQINLLFKAIDTDTILGVRDYAIYALMYQLGLRVGEVHSLNLASLDIKNKKILVIGKGKKPRTLPMNDELSEILGQYLALRDQFYNSWLTPSLFVSKKGNRLAIRTMEDNFKKILLQTDFHVPFNVTCHTLRHSLASHLNNKDVDILIIQSILGHSSTRSTEPYIHPSYDSIRMAMEKLPGVKFVKELSEKEN